METRRDSANASEIADRAADPSYRTVNTNVAIDITRRVKRTEIGHLWYMQPLKYELPPGDRVCTYSTISKRLRIHVTLIQPRCTFRIWYAYTSSVRDVRTRKMSGKIAYSAAKDNRGFGRIR